MIYLALMCLDFFCLNKVSLEILKLICDSTENMLFQWKKKTLYGRHLLAMSFSTCGSAIGYFM